ncbi:MAG: aminotransferase class III-fold pyridoxal phosphate-dependent enzyme [Candidatus Heimdallarchaeota archaeon]|nr:aminotransferase class III-fold pyridoxal phosphate-dependent enzyme [Candidatus Heimdallarchaeota archaeon]
MMETILQTNIFEPILIEKANGSWFWDTKGNKYLDCVSGTWCVNLGHNHPRVIQAMKEQMDKLVHRSMRFLTPMTLQAAEDILLFFPHEYDKITFLNSGTEAVEFAINFAQKATNREKVLSLKNSYLGAYGIAKQYSYTSSKASDLKIDYPECDDINCNCLEDFNPLIEHIIENYSSELACFALEPILVSGGIHKPCTNFINELCKQLQEVGVLIVIDEVTTGFGRTGRKFGYEHYDITPDVIALGKAMGNGYPISAIITKAELEEKISPSNRYYAQSHQLDPLGAIAAATVVKIFEEEKVIEKSQEKIKQFNAFFQTLSHPAIKEIRSHGMLFGIQVQSYNNISSTDLVLQIKDKLLDEGVLIGYSVGKELLRLLPPLTITTEEREFVFQKLTKVFNEL